MVHSLLRLAKLDWPVPDFSTVCRRQKTLQVELSYQRTKSPLQLLVDSTGIKFLGEGECKRKKHGAEYRREWRKVHLGIDAQTRGNTRHRGDHQRHRRCTDAARFAGRDPARRAHRKRLR
jgi:hypothetical protein